MIGRIKTKQVKKKMLVRAREWHKYSSNDDEDDDDNRIWYSIIFLLFPLWSSQILNILVRKQKIHKTRTTRYTLLFGARDISLFFYMFYDGFRSLFVDITIDILPSIAKLIWFDSTNKCLSLSLSAIGKEAFPSFFGRQFVYVWQKKSSMIRKVMWNNKFNLRLLQSIFQFDYPVDLPHARANSRFFQTTVIIIFSERESRDKTRADVKNSHFFLFLVGEKISFTHTLDEPEKRELPTISMMILLT